MKTDHETTESLTKKLAELKAKIAKSEQHRERVLKESTAQKVIAHLQSKGVGVGLSNALASWFVTNNRITHDDQTPLFDGAPLMDGLDDWSTSVEAMEVLSKSKPQAQPHTKPRRQLTESEALAQWMGRVVL